MAIFLSAYYSEDRSDCTERGRAIPKGRIPLLKCDTDEACLTPPVNFVGLAGTDSYNVKTVIANEFWVGYTKNFPFFGASPFVKQEVKNGEVKDFLRSNGLYEGGIAQNASTSAIFTCRTAVRPILSAPLRSTKFSCVPAKRRLSRATSIRHAQSL